MLKEIHIKETDSKKEDIDFLKSVDILTGFTRPQLYAFLQEKKDIAIDEGEVLFNQGEPGDQIFIVKKGELDVFITRDNCKENVVSTMGPGQTIGEMQILFKGLRTAGVRAKTRCLLFCLSTDAFRTCAESSTDAMERIVRIIRRRVRRDQLLGALPVLFGRLNAESIRDIQSMVQWVELPAGAPLFMKGDESDSAYIVINGTLHAYTGGKDRPQQFFLREMTRGDCVGEMGIISEDQRSASVFAARESLLIRFSKPDFEQIMTRYPEVRRGIMKLLIKRLQDPVYAAKPEKKMTKIAILPAGTPCSISDFTGDLCTSLSGSGTVLHLSSKRVDDWLGAEGISQAGKSDPRSLSLTAWMEAQQERHRYILLEADPFLSSWTRHAVSAADHILLVARAEDNSDPGPLEKMLFDSRDNITRVGQTLVLLHKSGKHTEGTIDWLSKRCVRQHHHVYPHKKEDMARLARFLTESAVGLVLGGGGARGFAHIGVIKALREAHIPIDLVGGTSMGAIVAAQAAMGWDIETIIKKNYNAWIKTKPLNDYTLPVYSLLTGKKVNKNSRDAFGNQSIEDLPINFFCVSSNLTQARPLVHRQGPLWKAVRASGSLPGIFRPWVLGSDLLVDGGIMNNLPGDIMREMNKGPLLIVDVNSPENMAVSHPAIPSPWRTAWKKISPFAHSYKDPTMLDILVRSTMLASLHRKEQVKKEADLYFNPPVNDFGLLEFKALEDIIHTGYEYAKNKIRLMETQGTLPFQWSNEC